jgi:hypothetical protein
MKGIYRPYGLELNTILCVVQKPFYSFLRDVLLRVASSFKPVYVMASLFVNKLQAYPVSTT